MPTLTRYEFDAAYLERLSAGDSATERHFTSYFRDLVRLKLRSRLRSPTLVEDVTQEVFLRVLTTLRQKGLESAPSLGAFVNGVCNHVLFETYRGQAKARRHEAEPLSLLESPAASAETNLADAAEHERVRQAITRLPDRERTVLRALFFDERPKDDLCRELGVDRDYLRVLLHRAKAKFKEQFDDMGDAEAAAETLGPRRTPDR